MRAREIHEFLRKTAFWNNWSQTCDGFLWGDQEQEVKGIAVCWCTKKSQIEAAVENNCNLFITHEPLYSYANHNQYSHPLEEEKTKLLRESGIVVYRCHDVLDMFPEIGIPDSWGRVLGFEGPPCSTRNYYRSYRLPEGTTTESLANMVLERTAHMGQKVVHIVGPRDKQVTKVVVGTGAITNFRVMAQMGDVLILTDDGTRLWESAQWAMDTGTPLLIVNHATAEEPGLKALAKFLDEKLEVPVHFIPQGCLYTSVSA